jgi:GrpB-like predicted nucleotidyltransferase (UPF0157 family)
MKKYEFKPYNPDCPKLFSKEMKRLAEALLGEYQIEHIGSTAVPGLGGKGIIDIMIATTRSEMENISEQAQKAGYIFRPLACTKTRLFLRTEYPEDFSNGIAYHLHITFPESADWKEAIAFRNYLRAHPEDLEKYAEIKKQAAQEANENTDKYKSIKEGIIKEIIRKAI